MLEPRKAPAAGDGDDRGVGAGVEQQVLAGVDGGAGADRGAAASSPGSRMSTEIGRSSSWARMARAAATEMILTTDAIVTRTLPPARDDGAVADVGAHVVVDDLHLDGGTDGGRPLEGDGAGDREEVERRGEPRP